MNRAKNIKAAADIDHGKWASYPVMPIEAINLESRVKKTDPANTYAACANGSISLENRDLEAIRIYRYAKFWRFSISGPF